MNDFRRKGLITLATAAALPVASTTFADRKTLGLGRSERVGAPPRQSAPFSRTLLRRPGRQIALQLPVRPTARPSLNIDMSTLVFADPSYDRELSGPSPSDPQRDNAGVF